MGTESEQLLKLAQKAGVLRTRDVEAAGIHRSILSRLVAQGSLSRTARGLYVLSSATRVGEHHSLVEASKRVPKGVVCLISALRYHGIGTQAPFEVWIAIDIKAHRPTTDSPPIRIARFSGAALTSGVEERKVEGVTVPIYSLAKTVADCFKYRNKIGQDVALEALREYMRSRKRNLDELWRFAKICRVERVMQPYLEAMT